MEIDKTLVDINGHVDLIFFGLEKPILKGMLKKFGIVEADQEISHIESLLIDMHNQIEDVKTEDIFAFSLDEADLAPLLVQLSVEAKLCLSKIASNVFELDTEAEIMIVRNSMIASIDPGEEDSEAYIKRSFKPRDIARSMLHDFANPDDVTFPRKQLV